MSPIIIIIRAIALTVSLALVAAVAAFGGRYAPSDWYEGLAKPSWTPPDWVFGPVWSALYVLMAIAAWLVWREGKVPGAGVGVGLAFYFSQLVLNGLWSWIFFGQHRIGMALADLLVLWILVLATIILFWRVRRCAALLLLPYIAWITFAGALNYALWQLNG